MAALTRLTEKSFKHKPKPLSSRFRFNWQVREIARNAKVQATHSSMEYPPNSGNGSPDNDLKLLKLRILG